MSDLLTVVLANALTVILTAGPPFVVAVIAVLVANRFTAIRRRSGRALVLGLFVGAAIGFATAYYPLTYVGDAAGPGEESMAVWVAMSAVAGVGAAWVTSMWQRSANHQR